MIRLLADENFNNDILAGLLREQSDLNIVQVQDVGLRRTPDPIILAWAAQEGRIVVSHDIKTMRPFAIERLKAGLSMPGLCLVKRQTDIGKAIEDLLILLVCTRDEEWENRIYYIPL